MSFAFAALVLSSLSPAPVVAQAALGQQVQVIKGGKKASPKRAPVEVQKEIILQDNSAEVAAKNEDLAQREQALQQKEAANAEAAAKNAERQKAIQKRIEKLSQQNHDGFQNAANALAGDE